MRNLDSGEIKEKEKGRDATLMPTSSVEVRRQSNLSRLMIGQMRYWVTVSHYLQSKARRDFHSFLLLKLQDFVN